MSEADFGERRRHSRRDVALAVTQLRPVRSEHRVVDLSIGGFRAVSGDVLPQIGDIGVFELDIGGDCGTIIVPGWFVRATQSVGLAESEDHQVDRQVDHVSDRVGCGDLGGEFAVSFLAPRGEITEFLAD